MKPKIQKSIPRSATVLAMYRRYHKITTTHSSNKKYEDYSEEDYIDDIENEEDDYGRESY